MNTADRHQQHEHAVRRVGGGEQREGEKFERLGHAVVDRHLAPDHLHHFLDDEGQAEGEQQFGHVAVLVHRRRP
jgi:hypothetical protein